MRYLYIYVTKYDYIIARSLHNKTLVKIIFPRNSLFCIIDREAEVFTLSSYDDHQCFYTIYILYPQSYTSQKHEKQRSDKKLNKILHFVFVFLQKLSQFASILLTTSSF